MNLLTLPFPYIDPVLVRIGGLQVRWYGLMYVIAFLAGYQLLRALVRRYQRIAVTDHQLGDLISAAVLGVIVGGRLGYVLLYNLPFYIEHPLRVFALWEGGMSFHGGLVGILLAGVWFVRRYPVSYLGLADLVVVPGSLGLVFGRIGNFINAELVGRPTDLPWGVLFPNELVVRHPSQLYAVGKDLLLFVILWYVYSRSRRAGMTLAAFLLGYGALRFLVEFTREPDPQIGLIGLFTLGQLLCVPLIVIGLWFLLRPPRWYRVENEGGTHRGNAQ